MYYVIELYGVIKILSEEELLLYKSHNVKLITHHITGNFRLAERYKKEL